jgi:thiamine-phosphate pyrophosphorylase
MRFDKDALLLYAVTDRARLDGRTLAECVESCLRGGATMVQLREKALDAEAFLEEALVLKALCSGYGVPFLVNDDVGIALRSGADGAHIGQGDMPVTEARRLLGPDKILGVSAQTVAQARQAERDGADYLGVGAVFPTGSKQDADSVTLETLRGICGAVSIPVVAIGGINRHNIHKLQGSGIRGVAVISALFGENNVENAARTLRTFSAETVMG